MINAPNPRVAVIEPTHTPEYGSSGLYRGHQAGNQVGVEGDHPMHVIDRFGAHQRLRNFSPKTVSRRRYTLRLFERFIAPTAVLEAAVADVEQFLGSRPAAATRHAYRSDLRVFFAWCQQRGLVDRSPAHQIDAIRVPRALPRPIPAAIAEAALMTAPSRVRRAMALALFAGLRCAEIAALRAEDVWLHAQPPALIVRKGKGAKDRTVRVHPRLAELLEPLPCSGPLFPGVGHETVRPESVSLAISEQLRRSGVDATAHQLRHTFGTELAAVSGGNLLLVAEVMGHASTTTTLGYARLAATHMEAIADMFGGDAA